MRKMILSALYKLGAEVIFRWKRSKKSSSSYSTCSDSEFFEIEVSLIFLDLARFLTCSEGHHIFYLGMVHAWQHGIYLAL
jgi:hypothetical protein